MNALRNSILRRGLICGVIGLSEPACRADDPALGRDSKPASLFAEPDKDAYSFGKGGVITAPNGAFEIGDDSSKLNFYGNFFFFSIAAGSLLVLLIGLNTVKKGGKKRVRSVPRDHGEFSVSLHRFRKREAEEDAPRKILAHRNRGKPR